MAEVEAEQVRGGGRGEGSLGTAGSEAGELTLKVMGKSSTFTWLSKSPAALLLLLLLLEAMLLQVAQIQLQLKWE